MAEYKLHFGHVKKCCSGAISACYMQKSDVAYHDLYAGLDELLQSTASMSCIKRFFAVEHSLHVWTCRGFIVAKHCRHVVHKED